jgi:hypothetical protein
MNKDTRVNAITSPQTLVAVPHRSAEAVIRPGARGPLRRLVAAHPGSRQLSRVVYGAIIALARVAALEHTAADGGGDRRGARRAPQPLARGRAWRSSAPPWIVLKALVHEAATARATGLSRWRARARSA